MNKKLVAMIKSLSTILLNTIYVQNVMHSKLHRYLHFPINGLLYLHI